MDFGVVLQTNPPAWRVVELAKQAENFGFTHVWTFDSHILWQEPYVIYSQILAETRNLVVGPMVTNPATPSCAEEFEPAAHTVPSVFRASQKPPPTLTLATPLIPGTCTAGASGLPDTGYPRVQTQSVPSPRTAITEPPPTESARTPLMSSRSTGFLRSAAPASSICSSHTSARSAFS